MVLDPQGRILERGLERADAGGDGAFREDLGPVVTGRSGRVVIHTDDGAGADVREGERARLVVGESRLAREVGDVLRSVRERSDEVGEAAVVFPEGELALAPADSGDRTDASGAV